MSKHRLRRRLASLMSVRTVLACAFALLVVSSGSLVLINNGTVSAAPDGIKDRATFTVSTGAIFPHLAEGGQICAEKIKPGVNRVIITDATLKNVDIYLGDEGEVQAHISFPTGEVNGKLVLYTNGENLLVNTLATLGICLPPGVPNPIPTTLEAYYLGVENLETKNLDLSSGGNAPEPSGPSLSKLLNVTDTSREELGLNNSTTSTNTTNSTNVINGTSNNSTVEEIVNKTTSTPSNNSTITLGNVTNTTTATNTTNSTNITETPSETVTPVTTTATPSLNETETNSTATSTPQTTGDTNDSNTQTSPTATPTPTTTPTATPTTTPTATPVPTTTTPPTTTPTATPTTTPDDVTPTATEVPVTDEQTESTIAILDDTADNTTTASTQSTGTTSIG